MNFKDAYDKLMDDSDFKSWRKDHSDLKLTTGFLTGGIWHLGFFDDASQKMSTFKVDDNVEFLSEDDVFKKPDEKLLTIDISKLSYDFDKIDESVEKYLKENFPSEVISNKIVVLHRKEELLWNYTAVSGLNAIRLRVSAESGKVLDSSKMSLTSLAKEVQ